LALAGEVEIAGPGGRRIIRADDFFTGLFETALTARDVLTSIRVPAATAATRVGFAELARRHGDYAMVGLAAGARAEGEALCEIRLIYFGVGPVAVRARNAERLLETGDVERAVSGLSADLHPSDDLQASAAVKAHLAGVLLRRVAQQLASPRIAGVTP
jgi:carbon-monoxide dehydrogenase medium subunit